MWAWVAWCLRSYALVVETAPAWVYAIGGISVVIYANLDSIDGKQARRTGSSSPLGQLFDHGIDAYVVHLSVSGFMSCASESCGLRASIGTLGVSEICSITAQWKNLWTWEVLGSAPGVKLVWLSNSWLVKKIVAGHASLDTSTMGRISHWEHGLWKWILGCHGSLVYNKWSALFYSCFWAQTVADWYSTYRRIWSW